MLQVNSSDFPNKYLGVILTHGRIKTAHVWYLVENMQAKLASWVGKSKPRIILIKTVLRNIHVYTMSIYKRPKSVLVACETFIRNFLWPGDSEKSKLVTLDWEMFCTAIEDGGSGIKRLEDINKALLMELLWKIQTVDDI